MPLLSHLKHQNVPEASLLCGEGQNYSSKTFAQARGQQMYIEHFPLLSVPGSVLCSGDTLVSQMRPSAYPGEMHALVGGGVGRRSNIHMNREIHTARRRRLGGPGPGRG